MLTNISRATLYLLISALEQDLRQVAEQYLQALKACDVFDEATFEKLQSRRPTSYVDEPLTLKNALLLADMGDCLQIINRHSEKLPENLKKYWSSVAGRIEKTIPIRNRVMHSRPLEWDDFPGVTDLSSSLVANRTDLWGNLRELVKHLRQEPEFALRANLEFTETSKILHNLPTPDFDDTGFIGRSDTLDELLAALRGPYPVISLIGEGGVGKSALALKACYTLLDEPSRFEAIVWTSAKSNRLTPSEIQLINNSISTSLGVIQAALSEIGANGDNAPLQTLLQHLGDFPIVLVIDNLETVLDENMRQLARLMPAGGSKLIFTTRIGLGALDFPIPVPAFQDKEAQHFLRRAAKIWRAHPVLQAGDAKIKEYCQKLQKNPLFMKWFVQTVRAGINPERVLANPKIVLEYCLENVFGKIKESQRQLLDAMVSTKGPHTLSLLSYFTDLPFEQLEEDISNLLGTNILSQRMDKEGGASFALSDLARLYIVNYLRPTPATQRKYEAKEKALTALAESFSSTARTDPYDENTLTIRSRADIPASQLLKQALDAAKIGNYRTALAMTARAQELAPDYFEIFRISGLINSRTSDHIGAEDNFEKAVAFAPEHAPNYYFFASFLLRQRNDAERGRAMCLAGLRRDGKSVALIRLLAQAEMFAGRYDETRRLLDSIAETIEVLPERQRRIWLDCYLQSFAREADRQILAGDFQRALQSLQKLRVLFESQKRWIDDKTCERLSKQAIRHEHLISALKSTPDGAAAAEAVDWFYDNIRTPHSVLRADNSSKPISKQAETLGNQSRGRIYSILDGYGFIEAQGWSERLFFYRGSFKHPADFDRLSVGDEIVFDIGQNYRGAIATNASIES